LVNHPTTGEHLGCSKTIKCDFLIEQEVVH
jgi:hypothetical protein